MRWRFRDLRPRLISAAFALLLLAGLATWPAVRAASCTSILIASSQEKAHLLSTLAAEYSAHQSGGWASCGPSVRVEAIASGDVERNLANSWALSEPRPDVWTPAATTWVSLLDTQRTLAGLPPVHSGTPPHIAVSPLVVGMPQPMAAAIGWPNTALTWSQLLAMPQQPDVWAQLGHPEWGPFRLGKTDPGSSTSGVHSLLAEYYVATQPGGMTLAALSGPTAPAKVAQIEAAVTHYAPTAGEFLGNLAADAGGTDLSFVSAVPVEEQELFTYDEGGDSTAVPPIPPRVRLVPIYPADGTLFADHPYVVLDEPWVTPAKAKIADDFVAWLEKTPQQIRFQNAGFRDSNGAAGYPLTTIPGVPVSRPQQLPEPTGDVVALVQASWVTIRKPGKIVLLVNASTRAELTSVAQSLGALSPLDSVAVWDVGPSRSTTLVNFTPASNLVSLKQAVTSARASPRDTALYAQVRDAYMSLSQASDPSRINAVVVIASSHDNGTGNLTQLERDFYVQSGAAPVRVYTVALQGSDVQALAGIAKASGGLSSSGTPEAALRDALANF